MYNHQQGLAPEIKAGRVHDERADIWSLGKLAYQLLTWQNKDQSPGNIKPENQSAVWHKGVPNAFKQRVL